jgi:hypothetical protein
LGHHPQKLKFVADVGLFGQLRGGVFRLILLFLFLVGLVTKSKPLSPAMLLLLYAALSFFAVVYVHMICALSFQLVEAQRSRLVFDI